MTSPPQPAGCHNWDATCSRVPPCTMEAYPMHQRPIALAKLRRVPRQCSWVDKRLVRDHSIDPLRPQACALSLFLGTVADGQGLRDDAAPSLCQRWAMTGPARHQARQALITPDVV